MDPLGIEVEGSSGYFFGGMVGGPRIRVRGNCGWSVGETILSGEIVVDGQAGNSAGASMRGGAVVIRGDVGARAGIAIKGGLLLICGQVGYMSGFMMQKGTMIVCGDASPAIGDSMYDGRIFVAGKVEQPGTDAVVEDPTAEEQRWLDETLLRYDFPASGGFKKIISWRRLWKFLEKGDRRMDRSTLRHSATFSPEVIEDIQVKAELGQYRIRGWGTLKRLPSLDDLTFVPS